MKCSISRFSGHLMKMFFNTQFFTYIQQRLILIHSTTNYPPNGPFAASQENDFSRCYVQISPPCSKAPVTLYALYEREQILTFSRAGFFLISNHETTQAFLHGEKIIKFTSCKKALVILSVYVSIYV